MEKKKTVFVGLSGGVDSAVTAYLLKQQGYAVVGVFIQVWQADFLECDWRNDRREAMRVAAHLNIPFHSLNLSQEYKKDVVDYMIREYERGRVPNPDVMCNKFVKFGAFLDFAMSQGADYIATGHYAKIIPPRPANSYYAIAEGIDEAKAQSYFLWTLTQEILARTLFPLGNLQKIEVRDIARQIGLPNASKKDSQGICFLGPVDIPEFLKHFIHVEPGIILDVAGNTVGEHDGALLYTIGQRHGLSVRKTSPNELPYFVIAKDITKNTVTVSSRSEHNNAGKTAGFVLGDFHEVYPGSITKRPALSVQFRYHGERIRCSLSGNSVQLHSPQDGVATGQSAVFFDNNELLGGGNIYSTCGE